MSHNKNQVVPTEKLRKWLRKTDTIICKTKHNSINTSIVRLLNNRSNKSLSLAIKATMVINIV